MFYYRTSRLKKNRCAVIFFMEFRSHYVLDETYVPGAEALCRSQKGTQDQSSNSLLKFKASLSKI